MDQSRREGFLAGYETARTTGRLDEVADYLSAQLVLEDPQLPGGAGDQSVFTTLTAQLAEETADLSIRRHGPTCVSADGTWFTQRWLADGRLQGDEGMRVAFETVEVYQAPGALVTRIAILVRDLTQGSGSGRDNE